MSMDELDPHVARALTLAARFQSALDGTLNQMNNGSFRATDEAETVEVTINGHQWLTGLRIEDGLLEEAGCRGGGSAGQRGAAQCAGRGVRV